MSFIKYRNCSPFVSSWVHSRFFWCVRVAHLCSFQFFVICLSSFWVIYPMLPVSLDCPFLIATSVFSKKGLHSNAFERIIFFFSFAFTLGFQLPLRIWWCSVGHPRVHKASPGVLLVMTISLLSMPDGSRMSVKCGRYIYIYLTLPLHRSTLGMVWFSWLCSDVGSVCCVLSSV